MISLSDRAGFLIVANLIKYAVGFVMPMALGLPTSVYYFYHPLVAARLADGSTPAARVKTPAIAPLAKISPSRAG